MEFIVFADGVDRSSYPKRLGYRSTVVSIVIVLHKNSECCVAFPLAPSFPFAFDCMALSCNAPYCIALCICRMHVVVLCVGLHSPNDNMLVSDRSGMVYLLNFCVLHAETTGMCLVHKYVRTFVCMYDDRMEVRSVSEYFCEFVCEISSLQEISTCSSIPNHMY